MMTLPPSVKIYVVAQPLDARKSFDGLVALVEAVFGLKPLSGHVFAFINRRGHVIRLLFWDRSGFCIVKKRLEAGTFRLANRFRFGRSTEKLSREELEQLRVAFGGEPSSSESEPEVPAPAEPEQADDGSDSNESEEQAPQWRDHQRANASRSNHAAQTSKPNPIRPDLRAELTGSPALAATQTQPHPG